MKKLLAFVLTLAMLLVSAAAVAETATEVAKLYLVGMSTDNGENWMNTAGMMSISFVFYDDGTLAMDAMGTTTSGTYEFTEDGSGILITAEGSEPVTLTAIDENTFVGGEEDQMLMFSTEEPEGVALPAAVPADDISAFDGSWNPQLISAMGMTFSLEEAIASGLGTLLGDEVTSAMIIDNGKATIFGEEMTFAFNEGKLSMNVDFAGDSIEMTIELCEDGSIVYNMNNLDIHIYYVK